MGYADDHSGDTFRFYNPETHKIILSRDVTWAEWHGSQEVPESLRMFVADLNVDITNDQIGEDETPQPGSTGPHVIPDHEDDTLRAGRKSQPVTLTASSPADPNPTGQSQRQPAESSRVSRELSKLKTYYNPTVAIIPDEPLTLRSSRAANESEEKEVNLIEAVIEVNDVYNVELASDPGEPKTVHEALSGVERLQWLKAMKGELENFLNRGVWIAV